MIFRGFQWSLTFLEFDTLVLQIKPLVLEAFLARWEVEGGTFRKEKLNKNFSSLKPYFVCSASEWRKTFLFFSHSNTTFITSDAVDAQEVQIIDTEKKL